MAVFAILMMLGLQMLILHTAGAQETQPDQPPEDVDTADCEKIPGGDAPVNILARLKGGMAVENLKLTYFNKPLHQLTQQDFDYVKKLFPFCQDMSKEQSDYLFDRLSVLVLEAQQIRQTSIDWITETVKKLEKMPATKASIEAVHNLEAELKNRQLEMTRADEKYLAVKLNDTLRRLYQEAPVNLPPGTAPAGRTLMISPFLPERPGEDRKPDPG